MDSAERKPFAGLVKLLPKGTVSFHAVLPGKYRGTVTHELLGVLPRGRGSSRFGGLRSSSGSNGHGGQARVEGREAAAGEAAGEAELAVEQGAEVSFAEKDLVDARLAACLAPGDVIQFSVRLNKRTKKKTVRLKGFGVSVLECFGVF